jgi:hypothetical protein
MMVNHHIAAQLMRERHCELLEAADSVRADVVSVGDGVQPAPRAGSAPRDGRLVLRSWRARRAAAAAADAAGGARGARGARRGQP